MAEDPVSAKIRSCRVTLVRHGQARARDGSYGRWTPLSELGRRQAAATADHLAQAAAPLAVYTSPLPRALETAAIIGVRLDRRPVVDDRLTEFELGEAPLAVAGSRPDLFIWRADHSGVPGGETLREFAVRVIRCVDAVVEQHLGEGVVVVSHSGTMEAILRWAVGLSPDAPWQSEFSLPNASVTELECWPHGRVVGGSSPYVAIGPVGAVEHLGELVTDL